VLQAKVSHPPLTIRRERIEKALEMLPPLAEFRVDSSSFAAARDRLRSR
jgi:hypothetical protein